MEFWKSDINVQVLHMADDNGDQALEDLLEEIETLCEDFDGGDGLIQVTVSTTDTRGVYQTFKKFPKEFKVYEDS